MLNLNEIELSKILEICHSVRNGIIRKEIPCVGSEDFPLGCCGNASYILERELLKNGFKNIKYVWGFRSTKSHGWLEYKDCIIDITCDQFIEFKNNEVLIIPKPLSKFHKEFIQKRPSF